MEISEKNHKVLLNSIKEFEENQYENYFSFREERELMKNKANRLMRMKCRKSTMNCTISSKKRKLMTQFSSIKEKKIDKEGNFLMAKCVKNSLILNIEKILEKNKKFIIIESNSCIKVQNDHKENTQLVLKVQKVSDISNSFILPKYYLNEKFPKFRNQEKLMKHNQMQSYTNYFENKREMKRKRLIDENIKIEGELRDEDTNISEVKTIKTQNKQKKQKLWLNQLIIPKKYKICSKYSYMQSNRIERENSVIILKKKRQFKNMKRTNTSIEDLTIDKLVPISINPAKQLLQMSQICQADFISINQSDLCPWKTETQLVKRS